MSSRHVPSHFPTNPYAEIPHAGISQRYHVDPFHRVGGILNFRGSVLWSIVPEIMFFTIVAAMVCIINIQTPSILQLPTTLISVLGTVLGFIISYRTSSAYERYSEGRKLWTTVILESRSWSRLIWYHIPLVAEGTEEEQLKCMIERKTMINLGSAFSVALKHYLRGEPGIGYKDLYPMVAFLPRYHLPSSNHIDRPDLPTAESFSGVPRYHLPTISNIDNLSTDASGSSKKKPATVHRLTPRHALLPSYNPPPTQVKDFVPFYAMCADLIGLFRAQVPVHGMPDSHAKRRLMRGGAGKGVEGNLPLEITLAMSGYVAVLFTRGPANNSGLERILYTPLPLSYGLHLQHTIWLYLLLLPLQIYATFGWTTVPAISLISFVYLGFLQIGNVIENPFGYDANDLDLDSFCHIIQNEANEVTAHDPQELNPMSYCFSSQNLPLAFYPEWEGKSAEEMIAEEMTLEEMKLLLKLAGGKTRSNAATRKAARDVVLNMDGGV